jgi:hypothetical protein
VSAPLGRTWGEIDVDVRFDEGCSGHRSRLVWRATISEHKATIDWKRETPDFAYETYNRDHAWSFDAGVTVRASANPAYLGSESCVDPEEAFVASLSSCHMLTFLAIAARKRLVVGGYHDEAVDDLPLHYGFHAPVSWYAVPEGERSQRCLLSSDQCIIDNEFFFVVGNLELPIVGLDERFSWEVWVSIGDRNFARTCELWQRPGRESEPPYFAWLKSSIPGYSETLSLKTMVHTRAVGVRPRIELEPTSHPLAVEQREGITWERVQEIAEIVLHSGG